MKLKLIHNKGLSTMEYVGLMLIIMLALYISRDFILRGFQGRIHSAGETFAFGRQYDPARSVDCKCETIPGSLLDFDVLGKSKNESEGSQTNAKTYAGASTQPTTAPNAKTYARPNSQLNHPGASMSGRADGNGELESYFDDWVKNKVAFNKDVRVCYDKACFDGFDCFGDKACAMAKFNCQIPVCRE